MFRASQERSCFIKSGAEPALGESAMPVIAAFLIVLVLPFFATPARAATTTPPRPNVVFILADDLGYSDLGCYGSEIQTRNLDRLAASGIRLSQFYTTPRCCPTRASLLTGLYPHQAGIGAMMEDRGVPGYRGELNRSTPTIAEELRRSGYHTAMAGKWHVSHIHFNGKAQLNFESDEPFWEGKAGWPQQRGFEAFWGTIHGVDSYYDPFSLVSGNSLTKPEGTNFYYTDAIAEHAVRFIEQFADGKQPFFLHAAFTAPHWPLQAPEADIAKYRSIYSAGWDVIRSNRYQRQLELGLIDKKWAMSPRDPRVPAWEGVTNKEWEANRMATYAAMVEHLDRGIGRIMDELHAKGVDKNTLVMFMSDNGACAEVIEPGFYDVPSRTRAGLPIKVGNHDAKVFAGPETVWQSYGIQWANVSDTPFLLYKHFTHEGGIATPFIACWPGTITNGGAISKQLGHVTDIMATCLDVAGAKRTEKLDGQTVPPLEGESLMPIFSGKTAIRKAPIFWEHEGNRAVRSGKWKLVARHGQPWELYDIEADRTESKNLAANEQQKVSELAALYAAWAVRCNVLPPQQLPRPRKTFAASKSFSAR
jgi:arylsulfatase A-like enzyme